MSTNILVFQMLHYAQQKHTYNQLLQRAEEIFPSSTIYNNFKNELNTAFNSQQSLDDYEFALDTFESLKTYQTSPVQVESDLAQITSDPRFSAFTEIATLIDMPYSDTMFVPTVQMAQKISEETFYQPDLSIMSGITDGIDVDSALTNMPKTNKTILNVTSFGISNPEVLFTGDGYLPADKITTQKIEDAKEKSFENAVTSAQTVEDVNIAIESMTALNNISVGTPAGDQDFATSIDSVYTPASSLPTNASEIIDPTLTSTIAEKTAQASMLIEEEKKKASGSPDMQQSFNENPEANGANPEAGGPHLLFRHRNQKRCPPESRGVTHEALVLHDWLPRIRLD